MLTHDINVCETGLVIQPNLYWPTASPDGLISNHYSSRKADLIEIKCPKSKCNCTPQKILQNKFYVHYEDGKLQLKKHHYIVITYKFK